MNNKQELEDIKLFADFIEEEIFEEWDEDNDTKQIYLSHISIVGFGKPKDDWNLLHKAYEKAREMICNTSFKEENLDILLKIRISISESNKYLTYENIVSFIKANNTIQ